MEERASTEANSWPRSLKPPRKCAHSPLYFERALGSASLPGGRGDLVCPISEKLYIIAGYFKGPRQSGKIQGWVNVHHIEFSTDTREVLTFRGQIKGNTMSGLYGINGKHAEWHAERTN
jgi:hypothetical protein